MRVSSAQEKGPVYCNTDAIIDYCLVHELVNESQW